MEKIEIKDERRVEDYTSINIPYTSVEAQDDIREMVNRAPKSGILALLALGVDKKN